MFALLLNLLAVARAETAAEIVEKARVANRVDSAIETLTFTVTDKAGRDRVKELTIKSRREGDTSKTLIEITAPSTEAGMKVLRIDGAAASGETVLYYPAQKRTMLVSGAARTGAFLGSDLTYEDMEIRDHLTGTHTLVEDRADAWVVDTALTSTSYTKVRSTIRKVDLVAAKVEFFGPTGPVKSLEVLATEKDGAVNLPVHTKVTSLTKGSTTTLKITSHQLNVGKDVLPDDVFTRASLER